MCKVDWRHTFICFAHEFYFCIFFIFLAQFWCFFICLLCYSNLFQVWAEPWALGTFQNHDGSADFFLLLLKLGPWQGEADSLGCLRVSSFRHTRQPWSWCVKFFALMCEIFCSPELSLSHRSGSKLQLVIMLEMILDSLESIRSRKEKFPCMEMSF